MVLQYKKKPFKSGRISKKNTHKAHSKTEKHNHKKPSKKSLHPHRNATERVRTNLCNFELDLHPEKQICPSPFQFVLLESHLHIQYERGQKLSQNERRESHRFEKMSEDTKI